MLYYSKMTGGFYDDTIHGSRTISVAIDGKLDPAATIEATNPACLIPADAVEISGEEHVALLAGQSNGKRIVADEFGRPVLQPPVPPTADEVKAAAWERIKAERDRRAEASGFVVVTKWYHSDGTSKLQHLGNKDTARDQLAAGGTMASALLDPVGGQQIVWKTMDGTFVPLTCQLAFDIVKAGKGAEFAHFKAAETHKAAMEASADPAAYDFKSAGWPATFGG